MPTATVTSKGQITIPLPVRQRLGLRTGDRVDFFFEPNGRVVLQPKKIPFEQLCGIVKSRRKRPLSVRDMDRAIGEAVTARYERISRMLRDDRRGH